VTLPAIFLRATVLCAIGGGVYLSLAQLFGIRELATFERMLLRRLKLRRPTLSHVSDAPPHSCVLRATAICEGWLWPPPYMI
jgi:hypothetical protein